MNQYDIKYYVLNSDYYYHIKQNFSRFLQTSQSANLYKFFFFGRGEEIIHARSGNYLARRDPLKSHSRRREKSDHNRRESASQSIAKWKKKYTHLYKPRRQDSSRHKGFPGKKRRRSSLPTIQMEIKEALTWNRGKNDTFFSRATNYNMNRRDEIHQTPFNHEPPILYAHRVPSADVTRRPDIKRIISAMESTFSLLFFCRRNYSDRSANRNLFTTESTQQK